MFSGRKATKQQNLKIEPQGFAAETLFLRGKSEKSRYQIAMLTILLIGSTLFIALVEALNGFSFSSGPFL